MELHAHATMNTKCLIAWVCNLVQYFDVVESVGCAVLDKLTDNVLDFKWHKTHNLTTLSVDILKNVIDTGCPKKKVTLVSVKSDLAQWKINIFEPFKNIDFQMSYGCFSCDWGYHFFGTPGTLAGLKWYIYLGGDR